MLVSEIMSRELLSLSPSDPITKFISMMERAHVHESVVVEKGKLKGFVRFDSLLKRGITDPSKQKVANIMEPPPASLVADSTVEEAAGLLWKSGLRALPVLEDKRVVGMLSIWDILDVAARTKTFRQTRAEAVMSVAEVIQLDTDIGAARVLMRERGISRLPVVDANGKLAGVVTTFDLLRAIRMPREKMGWYSMAAEMERIVSLPVSNIMNDQPPTASAADCLSEIVGKLIRFKNSGLIVADNNVPTGVITVKDLLDVYAAGLAQKGVYYHTIGLEAEDEMVVGTVHRMIGDTLQKISNMVHVQFAVIHFKRHKLGGLRTKWSVRVRVRTDRGTAMSKAWSWDPRDAAGKALDNLERTLVKKRESFRDKLRYSARRLKGFAKSEAG